jgi:peptidoglycan/xylan/chitin deacetylase (PgdA/CDA1 family)
MAREGHAVGIHGETHRVRPLFRKPLVEEELAEATAAVSEAWRRAGVDGPPVTLFRPPFGVVTETTARAAETAGLGIVLWTVSVEDWRREYTADAVTEAILARARPGDVVVLHDGDGTHQRSRERCVDRPHAAAVVSRLVPALAARGLAVAPLDQVLGLTRRAAGH